MGTVAFMGGQLVCRQGAPADMVVFFNCLRHYLNDVPKSSDGSDLIDRLYRKYWKLEDLDNAISLLSEARAAFERVALSEVNWVKMGLDAAHTQLDVSSESLAAVFNKYFLDLFECISMAKSFAKTWNEYLPVRVIRAEIPNLILDKEIPLKNLDDLKSEPLWLG